MFIGFDIGNTHTTVGLYSMKAVVPDRIFRIRTEKDITSDELGIKIINYLNIYNDETGILSQINGTAFSSVVPDINHTFHQMSESYFKLECLEISHKSRLSIILDYRDNRQLGVDRIVNAEAVHQEFRGDTIIIDLGTATTFCILMDDGTFEGGLIAPGIKTTIQSLESNASKLPGIRFEKTDSVVAKDSINGIKSGFFYGWLSLVEGIVKRIENEYKKSFNVVLTGGFSSIISENIAIENIADPCLTMKGIKYIYDLNS